MTAQPSFPRKKRRNGGIVMLPLALLVLLLASACLVIYLLWPTWPATSTALDAPPIPVTVAGEVFDIPPAAIRVAVQRHPGPHQRIDLAFLWPSLKPPHPHAETASMPPVPIGSTAVVTAAPDAAPATGSAKGMLFVTIEPLGPELPPRARLRRIYPRYVAARAAAGPQGLTVLPFRASTPYQGQDIIYAADDPSRFFALCTRAVGPIPGTCLRERLLGRADVTVRFSRQWLGQWRSIADGLGRLLTRLQPQSK